MAQIRTGTADVFNGDTTVTASAGNDWSAVTVNSLFSVPSGDGSSVYYTIASVTAPGASVSGKWELELTAPYAGDDAAEVAYVIHKDFTALGIPILAVGDTLTANTINRGFQVVEAAITNIVVQANGAPFIGTFTDTTGGSGCVDSLPTTTLATGILYLYNHATNGAGFLMLNAGTAANALPGTFRPLDYNASTNAKYWTIRS